MNVIIDSIHSDVTTRLRRRRFGFFDQLLEDLEKPLRILDCGGTIDFWQTNGVVPHRLHQFDITILNLFEATDIPPQINWLVGDVRDLKRFRDREFDVVFSNSVINLMPSWEDQCRMSREVMRVGKRYYVQAPNRHFPIDWRTLVPFFHFLSPQIQAWSFAHFRVGAYPRIKDRARAYEQATRVRDLSAAQMRELFPKANIFRERCFGMTKSLASFGGWS